MTSSGLAPEEESGWTISPWMNISEQKEDPCDAQTNPLRTQITQTKKQLATVKAQAELQQIIINKTIALNKINADTAKAQKEKAKQTELATNSFNRKIDNANKALANMPEVEPVTRISEQGVQLPAMGQPDCSKEINSLNNIFINLGYRDRLDKAFLAANTNTIDTPAAGDRYLKTETDSNSFNFRYNFIGFFFQRFS